MDIQTLLGDAYNENMTIEEINSALSDKNLVDPATLPKSVSKDQFDKTASELAALKKELATIKTTSMTAEEQLQAQLKEVEDSKAVLARERSELKAAQIFTDAGLSREDYADILATVVHEDLDKTLKTANAMVNFIKNQKANTEKAVKEELLRTTPVPPQGNGATVRNFEKEIEEATQSGNMPLVARLITEQQNTK